MKGVLSKCCDIDGEHIDSEGIEMEGGDGDIDLDYEDNNLDNSSVHNIDIFDKTSTLVCGGELALLGPNIKSFPIQ